jgi:hypothetical protein
MARRAGRRVLDPRIDRVQRSYLIALFYQYGTALTGSRT